MKVQIKAFSLAFLVVFSAGAWGGEHLVKCEGEVFKKTELTLPLQKGEVTFVLNGETIKEHKENWIFANKKNVFVTEEITLVTGKKEFRYENLGTCPEGKSIRVRYFEVDMAKTKVFLEETACTCEAKN